MQILILSAIRPCVDALQVLSKIIQVVLCGYLVPLSLSVVGINLKLYSAEYYSRF